MVRPSLRTRAIKKKRLTLPGGDKTTHYRKKHVSKAHCSDCGSELAGVPAKRAAEIKKIPKTSRRPERAYGGTLCHTCVEKKMRQKARDM